MGEQLENQAIKSMQDLVNELKTSPQFAEYVKMHKVSLIDSRLGMIDQFLDTGVLKD